MRQWKTVAGVTIGTFNICCLALVLLFRTILVTLNLLAQGGDNIGDSQNTQLHPI